MNDEANLKLSFPDPPTRLFTPLNPEVRPGTVPAFVPVRFQVWLMFWPTSLLLPLPVKDSMPVNDVAPAARPAPMMLRGGPVLVVSVPCPVPVRVVTFAKVYRLRSITSAPDWLPPVIVPDSSCAK